MRRLACLAGALALALLVPAARAQDDDRNVADGAAIEAANRASESGDTFGRSGVVQDRRGRVHVPEPEGFTDSAFWVPARWLPSDRRHPRLNGRQQQVQAWLPEEEAPWSYQWWPSSQAHLAFRETYDQSPLEKLDTVYANARAQGGGREAVLAANPEAALWEADPDNRHNTAEVRGPGGGLERAWRELVDDNLRGVRVENVGRGGGGDNEMVVDGRRHAITRRTTSEWHGQRIELFYYDSGYQGRESWVTWVPGEDGEQGTWWHVLWYVDRGGYLRQHGYPGARVEFVGGGGGAGGWPRARLTHGGRTYDVVRVTDQWQGQPIDIFYYQVDPPPGAPPAPGFENGEVWNRFVVIPSLEAARQGAAQPRWVHIRWEYTERPGGVQWEGHCMGYAAAAVLFREPPASKSFRLDGRGFQKLVLRARRAEEARRENLRYETAGQSSRIEFGNRDLKGLATVLAQAFTTSFDYPNRPAPYDMVDFGTVVREGASEAAYEDILPHHMHRIFLDFLRERRRPVVMDYSRTESIYNAAVFSYQFTVEGFSPSPRPHYRIDATVGYAGYGESAAQRGLEPLYWRLSFDIFLDGQNRVVGSRWVGESRESHPDFLWVPVGLGTPKVQLGRYDGNPRVPRQWVLDNILVDARGQSLLRDFAR